MDKLRYVGGIDPSLNGTALSRVYSNGSYETMKIDPGDLRDFARIEFVVQATMNYLGNAEMVAIEGPATGYDGSKQRGRHENAGMWWHLSYAVAWMQGLPLAYVAPNTLKMYATGAGTGAKIGVMMALATRFGFTITDADRGDALVVAAMAADHLGFAPRVMPKTHLRALDSVVWPMPGDRPGVSLFASTKTKTAKASAPRQRKASKAADPFAILLGPGDEAPMLPLPVGEGG